MATEDTSAAPRREIELGFEVLVRQYRPALERLARRHAASPEDAEDLLQESLIDAYRGFHRFRRGSSFYAWLARIIANNHLDRVRRRQHATVPLEEALPEAEARPDAGGDPAEILLRGQLEAPFDSAIAALQPPHRSAVLLCDLGDATYEEAASLESCPIGTIRSRLHRAHRYLRDLLAHVAPAFQGEAEAAPAPPPLHSRRAFLRMGTAAVAGAALSGLGSETARAAPDRTRVRFWRGDFAPSPVPGSVEDLALAAAQADGRLDVRVSSSAPSRRELVETDVLVLSGAGASRLGEAALRCLARRVRDGDMGVVILGPESSSSRALAAVLGATPRADVPLRAAASLELEVTSPRHPVAAGVNGLRLHECSVAAQSLREPAPDVVLCRSAGPDRTWYGMAWTPARGRVFCFLPDGTAAPETQAALRRLLENALRWCANGRLPHPQA